MTPEEFKEWLDERIYEMESKQKGWETSYSDIMDRGALHELKRVKEKYLSILTHSSTINKP